MLTLQKDANARNDKKWKQAIFLDPNLNLMLVKQQGTKRDESKNPNAYICFENMWTTIHTEDQFLKAEEKHWEKPPTESREHMYIHTITVCSIK